ncbi:unnamed protein product, partial [Polarella glacialis]
RSDSTEMEQKQLLARLHSLEDSFARCVGRVTQAVAAGVIDVSWDEMQAVPRFAVLRPCPGGSAVLEVFGEPGSSWELATVELLPTGDSSQRPAIVADEALLSLLLSGVVSGKAGAAQGALPKLRCADKDDFAKWAGALKLLRLLPEAARTEAGTAKRRISKSDAEVHGFALINCALLKGLMTFYELLASVVVLAAVVTCRSSSAAVVGWRRILT